MASPDIAVVAFIVTAFALFGGVLGWASWRETRNAPK
jgi:hypothetical protein